MNTFCPDLQLPWGLISAKIAKPGNFEIVVSSSFQETSPDVLGRHVSDIMSYPIIYSTLMEATFEFDGYVSIYFRDEFSASVSEENDENDGEGTTFKRFLSSRALSLLCASRDDEDAARLKHYRFVFDDDVIDIICKKPPTITKTYYREPKSRIA